MQKKKQETQHVSEGKALITQPFLHYFREEEIWLVLRLYLAYDCCQTQ